MATFQQSRISPYSGESIAFLVMAAAVEFYLKHGGCAVARTHIENLANELKFYDDCVPAYHAALASITQAEKAEQQMADERQQQQMNNLMMAMIAAAHQQTTQNYTEGKANDEVPSPETMVRAVEKTISDGHWWGNVSWSVVYRIYQIKGYRGTISQFVRDVSHWPFTIQIRFDCNDDAVGKPIRTGKISRSLDKWAEDGASQQFIILGEALMNALSTQP